MFSWSTICPYELTKNLELQLSFAWNTRYSSIRDSKAIELLGSNLQIQGQLKYACEVTFVNVGYSWAKLKFFFLKPA